MAEKKVVAVGERVRDFSLPAHDKKDVRLSTLRGKKVLLSWHPLSWTGICTEQMKSLEKHRRDFAKLGVVALGLSVDPVPAKTAWAASMKLKETRLLSDFWPHGKVARSLGIFRKAEGISQRANIILDETGKVIFVKVYPIGKLPDIEEILTFLKAQKPR
ncbi:MAG: redoxin domain-containing protein [Deltaproteobacteria bacterium]|nr:redoxin domain-containing protein [Deltaproteobacteria bacterium]